MIAVNTAIARPRPMDSDDGVYVCCCSSMPLLDDEDENLPGTVLRRSKAQRYPVQHELRRPN
jgi:hypothetical protein